MKITEIMHLLFFIRFIHSRNQNVEPSSSLPQIPSCHFVVNATSPHVMFLATTEMLSVFLLLAFPEHHTMGWHSVYVAF